MDLRKGEFLSNSALLIFVLLPLLITPGISIDAVNVGKFFLFVLGSCLVFVLLIKSRLNFEYGVHLKLPFIFLLMGLALPLLFSQAPLEQQIFGTWGRNIGILTHLATFGAFVFGTFFAKKLSEKLVTLTLLLAALASMSYGTFQSFGYDFVEWGSGQVFGSLGNINFYSAQISMIMSLALGYVLGRKSKKLEVTSVLIIFVWCIYLLIQANSLQGFVIALINLFLALHIFLSRKKTEFRFVVPSTLLTLLILVIFATFNSEPLNQFIANEISTVKIRLYFIQAAIQMFIHNPLSGVGIDSFEDWYRLFRPDSAYFGGDLNEPADSAHNLPLDYAATGGVCLLLFAAAIYFLVLKSIKDAVRVAISNPFSNSRTPLMCSFGALAFLLQALFSPQQIGLLSWGFLFCGMSYGFQYRKTTDEKTRDLTRERNQINIPGKSKDLFSSVLATFIVSIAIYLSSSPLLKEFRIIQAQKSENAGLYSAEINSFPRNAYLFRNGVAILDSAGYFGIASRLGVEAADAFPRNYPLIKTVIELRGLDSSFKKKLNAQLKLLDPSR